MRTHIDWLTFTMTPTYKSHYPDDVSTSEVYADGILGAWEMTFGLETIRRAFSGKWMARERSRAPYTDAWELRDAGVTLFASKDLRHCCVEISGTGCERLIALGEMREVLRQTSARTTRIDIACDIETVTKPLAFVEEVSHERMRASGHQLSETGETCYVGSQKSDRYARVYRYFAPHPRAHLLRIEHVFRREYAKKVAEACVDKSIQDVAAAAGKAFGWGHMDWRVQGEQDVDLSVIGSERKASNTVAWLINSCAPAFKRLVESGQIKDPVKFFEEYFLSESTHA